MSNAIRSQSAVALSHPPTFRLRCHCIQMEFARDGDLHDLLKQRSGPNSRGFVEAEIRSMSAQILSGISYIHSMDVVHRDLKPANVLREGARCAMD